METFSPDEVEFLKQAALFDWKEQITRKIKRMLERLREELTQCVDPATLDAPLGMDFNKWQIVRGERFHNLPYAYLDFPQFFSRDTKFTYRSMFWWGSGFIFAWILEGEALHRYRDNLLAAYDSLADQGLFLSLADTPWEWKRGIQTLPLLSDNRRAVADAVARLRVLKVEAFLDMESLGREPGAVIPRAIATFARLQPVVAKRGVRIGF